MFIDPSLGRLERRRVRIMRAIAGPATRRMTSSSTWPSNGFTRYPAVSDRRIRSRVVMSSCAVMKMIGIASRSAFICSWSSNPFMPSR